MQEIEYDENNPNIYDEYRKDGSLKESVEYYEDRKRITKYSKVGIIKEVLEGNIDGKLEIIKKFYKDGTIKECHIIDEHKIIDYYKDGKIKKILEYDQNDNTLKITEYNKNGTIKQIFDNLYDTSIPVEYNGEERIKQVRQRADERADELYILCKEEIASFKRTEKELIDDITEFVIQVASKHNWNIEFPEELDPNSDEDFHKYFVRPDVASLVDTKNRLYRDMTGKEYLGDL